jgi:capsular polysaccharide biosynthesis protein
MELRAYWTILWRRWWAVALPLLIVLAVGLLRRPPPPVYTLTIGLLVDVPSLPAEQNLTVDPRLTAPQAAEYLVDDFSTFVRGGEFARLVAARLPADLTGGVGQIASSTASQQQHRTVTMTISRGAPSDEVARRELSAIAEAAVAALREDSPRYFARLNGQPEVRVIDGPHIGRVGAGLRDRLDLPLRVLLGLLGGMGLAFLLHYLDTRVYDAREVEALGLHVLAEVPRGVRREK